MEKYPLIYQQPVYRFIAGMALLSSLPFLIVEVLHSRLYVVLSVPSYLVFHNITEFFSIMVSLSVFSVGWFTYDRSQDKHALFLSSAFLAIGLMDFMHTMGYAGMPPFFTPNSPNKSTQFWIAVRFFAAASFFASAFIPSGPSRLRLSKTVLMSAALSVSALVFTMITFYPSAVPATFAEGVGLTAFKKNGEYATILLLILASMAYARRIEKTGDRLFVYYLAAFILCIFSELVFAVYKSVFDTYNVIGHIYKVAAFYLIYKGIFASSVKNPYVRLSDANENLRIEITEHAAAEQRLKEAGAYNRSLIEASLDPLVTIGSDGKITDVNAATETATGRSRERLIGTDFSDYFTEPGKARLGYEQAFREGMVRNYALEIQGNDGRNTPVRYNAVVYRDAAGKVMGVFAAARDVTERVRAEEEIKRLNRGLEQRVIERTLQLSEANKELEAFAYSVSHDLRAPLRAVDGYSRMLEEDYSGKIDNEGKRILGVVRSETRRMGQLIDDLLLFSRIGRSGMNAGAIDMSGLAASVCEEVRRAAPGRGFRVNIGPLPPAWGDAAMARQVFVNLLSNAVKFTRPRTEAVIDISGESRDAENVYTVKDNGVGFDMQYAHKLFGVIQRLHSSEEFEGTGVGLAIVQRIIRRHGGTIRAESIVDQGAAFSFTLPKRANSAPDQELLAARNMRGERNEQRGRCGASARGGQFPGRGNDAQGAPEAQHRQPYPCRTGRGGGA